MTTPLPKTSPPDRSAGTIPAEKAFDRLYSQSWELTKLFPDYQFRFSATLTVILGWILTSKETQDFVIAHRSLSRYGTILLATTLVAFHSRWVLKHASQLQLFYAELTKVARDLDSAPPALLEGVRLVDRFLPISYIIINIILCAGICFVVVNL